MKAFLIGSYERNDGPSNVNKEILRISDGGLLYLRCKSKIGKLLELLIKILRCDIIIVSGICSLRVLKIITKSKKKIIYIMHGDIDYENTVNKRNFDTNILMVQQRLFEISDRIVCVSERYSEWVKIRYPQFKDKITFVNNGLSINRRKKKDKEAFSLAIYGDNRPIKANKYICESLEILHKRGYNYKLYVFGRRYPNCELLPEKKGMVFMGHIDKDDYYNMLDKIGIYILNSDVEPFGLTIGDAINCNCSVLMSNNIGASSVLKTIDKDVILNNHNPEEIAEKIIYTESHPNGDRLYNSIKKEEVSVSSSYIKLMRICSEVLE